MGYVMANKEHSVKMFARKLWALFNKVLDDLLILAGCGLILAGTYQVNPMATWFVGGVMAITLGILIGLGGRS